MNYDYAYYQDQAMSTAIFPKTIQGWLYPYMGLAEEAGEIMEKVLQAAELGVCPCQLGHEAELAKELGDAMWMTAVICEGQGLSLSAMYNRAQSFRKADNNSMTPFLRIVAIAGELVGKTAKRVRKGTYPNFERDELLVVKLIAAIQDAALVLDTPLHVICDQNLEKLASRQQRGVLEGSGDNR